MWISIVGGPPPSEEPTRPGAKVECLLDRIAEILGTVPDDSLVWGKWLAGRGKRESPPLSKAGANFGNLRRSGEAAADVGVVIGSGGGDE